jgi:hypothetical protein
VAAEQAGSNEVNDIAAQGKKKKGKKGKKGKTATVE